MSTGRSRLQVGPGGAVFLDRDGTINVEPTEGEYVLHPDGIELIDGAGEAVRRINESGHPAIVVTNQRGIARGLMTEADLDHVNDRLQELLGALGARIDAFYACTHHKDACACRKPLPGMLLDAARDHGVDLPGSAMIGDREKDVQAGEAAGVGVTLQLGVDAADLLAAIQLLSL